MSQKEVIGKIEAITSHYDFIHVLAAIILNDFCSPINKLDKKNYWEQLNYGELAFLIGLWVKKCKKTDFEFDINATSKQIHELMEQLHTAVLEEMPKLPDIDQDPTNFLVSGARFKEAFFYSSTGAYDYQYIDKAIEKYRYDEKWIKDNKRFSIDSFKTFFVHVRKTMQKKLDIKVRSGFKKREDLLDVVCLTSDELYNGNTEFKQIALQFTIELEKNAIANLNEIGDYNEYQTKPLIKLDENNYFIGVPFFLAEAIYESPFYWMAEDSAYTTQRLENRGLAAENMVYSMLSKVFGTSNTLAGVKIKKNSTNTITDIDVLCLHNDISIIVQVKSKKLTALSKQGSISQILIDFDKAVKSAFLQGLKCRDCISSHEDYIFEEKGIKVNNKLLRIKKTYVICIVLDAYPAISHLTHSLLYESETESALSLTVFDLDAICHFLKTPKRLSDYLIKRIDNCRSYHSENESCYLGFYLKNDLKKLDDNSKMMIDSDYGSMIDQLYYPQILKNNQPDKFQVGKSHTSQDKISRNDPCPCRSGLKYKRCHGKS